MKRGALFVLALCALATAAAHDEHAGHGAGPAAASAVGEAGEAADVGRTVRIGMDDTMRYTPGELTIARGETVRLVVANHGQAMHEIVLGTQEEIEQHRRAMRANPAMAHGAPYMAHVAPGAEAQILWRFSRAGTIRYACLLPGHYEAGMAGTIEVR